MDAQCNETLLKKIREAECGEPNASLLPDLSGGFLSVTIHKTPSTRLHERCLFKAAASLCIPSQASGQSRQPDLNSPAGSGHVGSRITFGCSDLTTLAQTLGRGRGRPGFVRNSQLADVYRPSFV